LKPPKKVEDLTMPRKPRSGATPGPRDRAARAGEVKPPKLSPAARRIWRQLAPDLEESELLTQRDALTLGIACEVGAFVQAAAATLHAEGLTTTDAAHKDTERRSPTWVVFTQAAAQWLAYAGALGLSPKARESLTMAQLGPADEFEAYLQRGAAMRAAAARATE